MSIKTVQCAMFDIDSFNVEQIEKRLQGNNSTDLIDKFKPLYRHTEGLDRFWTPETVIGTGSFG